MKTAAKWAGYVLFFIVCTLLFVYLTFPTDKAKAFAEEKLLEATGAERVEIGDLSLAGIGGVTLTDVLVELPALDMPTLVPNATTPGPVRLLQVDELEVDASIGGLMSGALDVSFEGQLQGGELKKGRYQREKLEDGAARHVLKIGELAGVNFGSEQMFQQLVGKDIVGKLSGSIALALPEKVDSNGRRTIDLGGLQADVSLMIRDGVLKAPIFATPMGQVQLTDAELGDVVLKVQADKASNLEAFKKTARRRGDDTLIHIAEASVRGPDIEVEVAKNSAITLRKGQAFKDAAVNIHLAVRVLDAFIDKAIPDPNAPKKTTQPNKGLRHMMKQRPLKPVIQNGVFGVGITGRIGSPRVRPERSVVSGFTKRVRPNVDRPDPAAKKPEAKKPTTRPAPSRAVNRPAPAGDRPIKRAPSTRVPAKSAKRPGGGMGPPFDRIGQPEPPAKPAPAEPEAETEADGDEEEEGDEGEDEEEGDEEEDEEEEGDEEEGEEEEGEE